MSLVDSFLEKRNYKKILLIVALVVTVGLIAYGIYFIVSRSDENIVAEEVDDPSGEVVRYIDQDPENPNNLSEKMFVVGFAILGEVGFSASQQDIIFTTVQDFFTENFPNFERISYRRGSIEFDVDRYEDEDEAEENSSKSRFELESNTGEVFLVMLDTKDSINNIEVIIANIDGEQIN